MKSKVEDISISIHITLGPVEGEGLGSLPKHLNQNLEPITGDI